MAFQKPAPEEIREALQRYAPHLAGEEPEFLGEGWSFWVFRAGDHVLRFPMHENEWEEFDLSRRLLPALAEQVSLPLPVPVIYGENGPNSAPFDGHRFIPGASLIAAAEFLPASARGGRPSMRLAPTFGRELGRFLRELHSFSTERALELGVRFVDGAAWHKERSDFYERVVRLVFPLISCEARGYTESRFETYLNDGANFAYEPRLIHADLDRQNILIDPHTGHLTGVIDFGGAVVGKLAVDLWLPLVDFEKLGIAGQLPDFLSAYGDDNLDLEVAQVEAEFIQFLWPFHDILFGQWTEDSELVEEGIRALNETLPRDFSC